MTHSLSDFIVLFFVQCLINLIYFFEKFTFYLPLPKSFRKKVSFYTFLVSFTGISTVFIFFYKQELTFFVDQVLFSNALAVNYSVNLPVKTFPISKQIPTPWVSAEIALVADKTTGKILYSKEASKRFPSASTTKIMTALVAIDISSPHEELTVSPYCTQIEGTKIGLPAGQKFKIIDLLYGLLMFSGADAACVLSNGKIPYQDFVWYMNRKATRIGMNDTYFTNPIGLDSVGYHYSTAEDLYKLAKEAMTDPTIRDIVKTKNYKLTSSDGLYSVSIANTNKLLWDVPQSVGIKTGTTAAAGEVLVYEYVDEEKDLVIIVMGSNQRFNDTLNLLNWSITNFSWR